MNTFYFENTPVTGSAQTGRIQQEGSWHTATLGLRPKLDLELTPERTLSFIGSLLWMDHYKTTPKLTGTTVGGGSERHSGLSVIYKTTAIGNNALALGASYGYKKFREEDQYLGGDLSLATAAANTSWREFSLFTEDRWTISEPLSVTSGLRYDKYSLNENVFTPAGIPPRLPIAFEPDVDGHFSPQISLAYQINPEAVAKLSYRHGFRMPEARHYANVVESNSAAASLDPPLPPHNLQPETVDTLELNLNRRFSEALSVELNLFHNVFEKQLSAGPLSNVWGDDAAAVIVVGGRADGMIQNLANKENASGAEIIADWAISTDTALRGSYSYVEVGNRLPQRTPVKILKLDLRGNLVNDKFHYSINYVFSSAMDDVGNPSSDQWHDAYKKSGHRFNLMSGYDVSESGSLYLLVHNLFEDDRPIMTFNSIRPNQGYLGSDERRIYFGYRTSFQ